MANSIPDEISELRRELASLRREFEAERRRWSNLQFAPESGGGSVVLGTDAVYLRPNSLTPSAAQIP